MFSLHSVNTLAGYPLSGKSSVCVISEPRSNIIIVYFIHITDTHQHFICFPICSQQNMCSIFLIFTSYAIITHRILVTFSPQKHHFMTNQKHVSWLHYRKTSWGQHWRRLPTSPSTVPAGGQPLLLVPSLLPRGKSLSEVSEDLLKWGKFSKTHYIQTADWVSSYPTVENIRITH